MTNKEYEALQSIRRRQFIDWLFSTIENEFKIPPYTFAAAIGMNPRTLANLKKGGHNKRQLSLTR